MTEEIWKDVVGYEGLYKVSNLGRIRSLKSNKIIKPYKKRNGYLRAYLSRKNVYIHRVVAQAFIPNLQNKEEVNHKDLDKTNNNVENLEWCTKRENMQHAVKIYKHFFKGKKVMCIETNKIYKNSIVAEKETGILSAGIRMNICGKHKTAGGFHWKQI